MVSAQENRTGERLQRAAALTGWSGLVVFAMPWFDGPPMLGEGANGTAVRRYLEDNLSPIGWGVAAQTVAFGAMVLFVVGLHGLMRDAELPGRLLSDLVAFSGALVAVWLWLAGALAAIPLVLADDDGSLAAYSNQALLSLDPISRLAETFGDLGTVPRGLLVLAVSLLAVRTRFLPRPLGYLGLVVATASLVGVVVGPLVVVGLFGFTFWILLLSVDLLAGTVQVRRRSAAVRARESVLPDQRQREVAP